MLISYLQLLRSNIEFYKKQQWKLAYYSLLLNAAIISLYVAQTHNTGLSCCVKVALVTFSVLVTIFSTVILWKLHGSIESEAKSAKNLSQDIKEIKDYRPDDNRRNANLLITVLITIVIAGGCSAFLLFVCR